MNIEDKYHCQKVAMCARYIGKSRKAQTASVLISKSFGMLDLYSIHGRFLLESAKLMLQPRSCWIALHKSCKAP